MLLIGVDPGLSGALAALDRNGLRGVADMPTMAAGKGTGKVKAQVNPAALAELLREWCDPQDAVLAVLERVGAMPGQGVASVFSLGDSFGCLRGVLAAKRIPVHVVAPGVWKKAYSLGSHKEQARARAIELYPQASLARKRDHGRAEAILLARYGLERFA
ncbi:MAG: crossover junction endodeoxyribonuclease [Betaproteobacteria bacterium]|nr:crossover junction endodeoxyribonuclease [Betaproteobacteria bacterium]